MPPVTSVSLKEIENVHELLCSLHKQIHAASTAQHAFKFTCMQTIIGAVETLLSALAVHLHGAYN